MFNNIDKIYSHRLRNLRIIVRLLRFAPYVRCVILNGSMAEDFPLCHPDPPAGGEGSQGFSSEILRRTAPQNDRKRWKMKLSSDIDLLIIAKSGRIYTCRAAVLFWTALTGLKRSNNENKSHAGKFCFNYFLTEGFLTIPHDRGKEVDKYCAENYSKSILLWGDEKLFDKYMKINWKWMKHYLPQISNLKSQNYISKTEKLRDCHCEESATRQSKFVYSRDSYIHSRSAMQYAIEKLLSGNCGNRIENLFKTIQIARINKDPAVKKYPEYIVYTDRELRFHLPKEKG